jgi:hypothetical protein
LGDFGEGGFGEGDLERGFEDFGEGELERGFGPSIIAIAFIGALAVAIAHLDANALATDALAGNSKFLKKLGPCCLSLLCRTDA